MGRFIFFVFGIIAILYFSFSLMGTPEISEGDIEDLFEKSAELQNNLRGDTQAAINFAAYNMSPNFLYSSINTVYIPGQEPRQLRANMNKKEYGDYLFRTMAQMSAYHYSHKIENIEISDDGQEATVTYSTQTTATQEGVQETRIKDSCIATLYMHISGQVMLKDVNCQGEMHVTPISAQPPAPPSK